MSRVNSVTRTEYGAEPGYRWHRAEWVTRGPGVRAIRYQTDYDLTVFLRNVAVAGGLEVARRIGRVGSSDVQPWFHMGTSDEHVPPRSAE